MHIAIAVILGVLVAVAGTVLALIYITPENKRPGLNKFFAFLHDLFNFKFLILEKLLKVLYIFNTLFCIGFGFFGLFSGDSVPNYFTGKTQFQSYALPSLLIMILGPIVTRLVYEGIMMFLLLVKNTTEINKKLEKS